MTSMIGLTIGQFPLESKLGEGGMGVGVAVGFTTPVVFLKSNRPSLDTEMGRFASRISMYAQQDHAVARNFRAILRPKGLLFSVPPQVPDV